MGRTKTITKRTKGKRGGRPPIEKEKRRNKTLTFRVRGNMHERIAEAARKSGRSVTEEIEHRLERSLLLTELTEVLEAARPVCRANCVQVGPSKDVRVGATAEITSKDDAAVFAAPESVRVDPRPAATVPLDPYQKACDAIATVLEIARAEQVEAVRGV